MPTVSGEPTYIVTRAASVGEIRGFNDASLTTGDMAALVSGGSAGPTIYILNKECTTADDGSTILNSFTSNGGNLPGRWKRTTITYG